MRKCVICGKEFVSDTWHPYQVTCGKQCNILRQRQRKQKEFADRRPKELLCQNCGKGFPTNKYNWKKAKWCKDCRVIMHREIQRKYQQLHPKPPRRQRMDKWQGRWWKVMERDNDTCQICGAKAVLVHHKDGTGEHDKPNHELDNLQALCASCHKGIHNITYRIVDGKICIRSLLFKVYPSYQVVGE